MKEKEPFRMCSPCRTGADCSSHPRPPTLKGAVVEPRMGPRSTLPKRRVPTIVTHITFGHPLATYAYDLTSKLRMKLRFDRMCSVSQMQRNKRHRKRIGKVAARGVPTGADWDYQAGPGRDVPIQVCEQPGKGPSSPAQKGYGRFFTPRP